MKTNEELEKIIKFNKETLRMAAEDLKKSRALIIKSSDLVISNHLFDKYKINLNRSYN